VIEICFLGKINNHDLEICICIGRYLLFIVKDEEKRLIIGEAELLAQAKVAFEAGFKAAEKYKIRAITKQFTGRKNCKI
jgi:hypothetical protein